MRCINIPRTLTKCEKCQGGALQFEPGEAGAEGAKLKKFSDAGGSQIQCCPTRGRFTLCERSRYTESDSKIGQWQGGAPNLSQAKPTSKQLNLNSPSDADGLKVGGCPTQPEPIFESRAVYKITLFLLLCTAPLKLTFAFASQPEDTIHSWYFFAESGYAWTINAGLSTKDTWVQTMEGCKGNVGSAPFSSLGIGKKWTYWIENSISYTYYQTFRYIKHQTPMDSADGNRMRLFSIDSQNALLNLAFNPAHHWPDCGWTIFPIWSVGIGVAHNQIHNFYQIVYQSDGAVGSVLTIGLPTNQVRFAWQGSFAIRLKPFNAHFDFELGYRYNSNGTFSTPTRIMTNNATAQGSLQSFAPWKGHLQMNSIYLAAHAIY